MHTHDACIQEVGNCDLFILIIGGRFGGRYVSDKSKSITNAEYEAAKESDIPVFTYVSSKVLSDQHVFKQNIQNEFASQINFPSIDKQEHAVDVFNFIDSVTHAGVNNALEPFDNFSDIDKHLKKQWAGMFYDFLKNREFKKQIESSNTLLSGIKSSGEKLEELVKSLYRTMDEKSAEEAISAVEIDENTRQFYSRVMVMFESIHVEGNVTDYFSDKDHDVKRISSISPEGMTWDQYLLKTGLYESHLSLIEVANPSTTCIRTKSPSCVGGCSLATGKGKHVDIEAFFNHGVVHSSTQQRLKYLKAFIKPEFPYNF